MLAAVTEFLRERRLLDPDDEPGYNITLGALNFFNIRAYTRGGASFHVRVKERGMFPAEYENYCSAWQAFPQHVPEPLARQLDDEWEVFVVRGVRHHPVFAGSVATDEHHLVQEIVGFLEASSQSARVARPVEPHRAFLHQMRERTTDPICAAIVGEWADTASVDDLPHIRQHGDFVISNLGCTNSGLVVFDWEDFGRVALPGLDLCTLVASDARFNADTLGAMTRGAAHGALPYARLLDECCQKIGLSPEQFRRMIPLYLAIFLDLKISYYGAAISELVRRTIHEL